MSDGRKNNGGNKNCGRKSKAEEQQLIEKLTPIMPLAFKALKNAIIENESWAVKMSFEYYFGKAKETRDVNLNLEQPLFPNVPKNNSNK